MQKITIKINGQDYPVNTSLRAAKQIQATFGHKPYMDLFRGFASMSIEDQIKILYTPFNLANPNVMSLAQFTDYILDTWGIYEIIDKTSDIIDAITAGGLSEEEVAEKKAKLEQRANTNK
jgi:hypothetical protein